jgi:cell division protein FtsN
LTKAPHHQAGLEENGKSKDEKHDAAPLNRDPPRDGKQRESTRAAVPAPSEKKPEQTVSLPAATATPAAEGAERKDSGKLWTVQVNAYPDERSARQLVDRLKSKGYNAQVTETRNKGKTWYRVRVGSYRSREEADKALEDLKSKEKFDKAFATSRQQ